MLAVPSAPVSAQELSAIAVSERERDYGRLTLQFRDRLSLPPYELTAENGVLRIVFEDAVETDISDSTRVLADFVTIARQDPDGRALRFGLARAVRINTMEAGETLFIDFLPSTWQGFPPPLPEEVVSRLAERAQQAAREAAEAERRRLLGELEPEVELRVGSAPTFTRYAFNWNVPFNVAVTQEGASLEMEFDYDVSIDLNPALIDQATELESIEFNRDGASLKVAMDVVPGSGLRWFQDDLRFIVDLDRDEPRGEQDVESDVVDRLLSQINPGSGQPETSTRFSSVGERSDEVLAPDRVDQVSENARDLDPAALVAVELDELVSVEMTNPETETVVEDTPVVAGEVFEALAQRPDVVTAPALRTGQSPEISTQLDDATEADITRVEVREDGDTTRIIFPFQQPTPAAAFRRESFVTLVFQSAIPFDLRSLRLELADKVRSIQPTRVGDLNLIHLELEENALISMIASGDRWVMFLGPSVVEPPSGLQLGRGTLPDGRAFAEVIDEGFGRLHRITHPHVGDMLYVVPMLGPTRGALARQDLVEFEVMPSVQGLVLRPKIDALEIEVEPGRVLVAREEGLRLSEVGLSLGSFGFSPDERPGYVDFRAYIADGPGSFKSRNEAYQNAIAAAEGPVRIERLLDFSRFLIAFGMGQEAKGLLDIAQSEAPSLEHDEVYLTLRAAALTLAGRHEDARSIAQSHAMEGVIDARFWGLLNNAALRDWAAVNAEYDEIATIFDGYPAGLVARARLDGIEAALEVQAVDIATDRLSQVDPSRLNDDRLRYRLTLLQAQLDLARGRIDEALTAFDAVRDMADGPLGAQATLLAIEARILAGDLTSEEGLEQLENLAVAWRGDETEVRSRMLLGDLYIEQGRYGDALNALKGVLIAQPEHRLANDVSDEMQSIFVDLFLNGEADRLPAIDALAMFYDFRELTPIGRRGDELVRRLADRLVGIDLLDQAADLLSHQVDNRLTGAAKAQVAADLALVYLMDYRPSEAVAVLQRSRVSQVPMSIERGRRVIEARALSELGRHELALEMLRDLEGTDVAGVRADVLWNAERWVDAGEALERALGERWNDGVPLDEGEMQELLRAAIAFSFADDEYALNRLRARYDAKMSEGIYASAFDVVTAPIEAQGSAFRDVVRGIAGLNTLNRFLSDYRSTFSSQATMQPTPGA
ncbi:MAG: tetratricopeptide repeat protein [Devosiaceae bacterium]